MDMMAPRSLPVTRRALVVLSALLALGCEPASRSRSLVDTTGPPTSSAAAQSSFPVGARDDLGRTIVVPAEPRRIVSLLPSHTETLFALGVGDRVVGVDDFSNVPPEVLALPKLGGLYDTRLESVLALKPDLVLGATSSPSTSTLERAGITVWAGGATGYDAVFTSITAIGDMVGRHLEAEHLIARIRTDVDAVESAVRDRPRVRFYFELDATPYAVGQGSFMGVLLAKAGGENVVPEALGHFPKVSPELIATANPELILGAKLDEIAERPGWGAIAAVRSGHVYSLSHDESETVMRPGPRLPLALRLLVRRLHPEVSL
jgi:iron complex transport system substrate-binding protein